MPIEIRRTLALSQTTFIEGWREVTAPTRLLTAMAVIRNPWFESGQVEDLGPEVREHCPEPGRLLTGMLPGLTGDALEGCGKASVVGMGGELEHAQALTHSPWFGNQSREAIQARSYFAFTNTRGAAGASLMIPLMDKDDGGRRSHYQTIHTCVPDAPAEDEIILALEASVGGHPNHRIGGRYSDLRETGRDADTPAGV
ncbi:amino acid synthesis family protein [Roseovarius salinarum]|uniref:amino acid synthesis family protein n=1 Tax=Roseovarius salinarum TaxID=1981892 RepID=UPI000C345A5A|nr:amino acid synthesis family protein [Roseovarius salinarum]